MVQINSTVMLQYLDTLLKFGNFTKAAEHLFISQPYLTQSIRKVETELGVPIIDREATPMQLTEAGRVYYQYLGTLEAEQSHLRKQIAQFSASKRMTLRVGILSSLGTFVLPLFVPTYLKAHPEVNLELVEAIPSINEKRLLNQELDFLIGQNPETLSPSLTTKVIGPHCYYAMIPQSSALYHPHQTFLAPGALSIEELLHERLILTTRGSAIRRQIDYLIQKYQFTPDIVLESDNIFSAVALAHQDLGVTFVPESVATGPLDGSYNLWPLPLDLLSLHYYLAYNDKRQLNSAESAFVTSFVRHVSAAVTND